MAKSKKDQQPYWRPNFVNSDELPDIKVVRTDFIVNFVAIAIALLVTFILFEQEYRAYSLGQTVSDLEEQIGADEVADKNNLKLSEAFRKSAQYVLEVRKFNDAPFFTYELLLGLSEIRPDDLIFDSVSLGESTSNIGGKNVLVYTINILGDAKSLTVLDEFKKTLSETELLKIDGYELSIDETLQGRDAKTGIFPYRLAVSLTPEAKKSDSKAGEEGSAS